MLSALQPEIKLEEKQNALDKSKMNSGPFSINREDLDSFGEFKKNADWTLPQNAKYVAFIEANCKKMEGKPHGKLWGFYQEMAKIVKTRNFRQCKSHHQKMLNQHKSIYKIISYFLKSSSKFQILLLKQRENFPQTQAIICNSNQFVEQAKNEKDPNKINTAISYNVDKNDDKQDDFQDSNPNAHMVHYPPPISYQMPQILPMPKSTSEEWRECHQLFIEWTSRLKSLMMPPFYY